MNPNPAISFECLPLRSFGRLDVPLDASDEFRARCHRLRRATEKHGLHNSYYLVDGKYALHLTSDPEIGMLEFRFEGTVLTDGEDRKTLHADLAIELRGETCDWLTEPAVAWFHESVSQAVRVEFDRFIAAGDLQRTIERIARLQSESDAALGFLGMGL